MSAGSADVSFLVGLSVMQIWIWGPFRLILDEGAERDSQVELDIEGDAGAGFQLAQTIRKHRPAVRVVLAAGVPRAAAEAGELCEQGPAQRKPYDHRTLERHIRRLLAR